jgi:hypothetical protein
MRRRRTTTPNARATRTVTNAPHKTGATAGRISASSKINADYQTYVSLGTHQDFSEGSRDGYTRCSGHRIVRALGFRECLHSDSAVIIVVVHFKSQYQSARGQCWLFPTLVRSTYPFRLIMVCLRSVREPTGRLGKQLRCSWPYSRVFIHEAIREM